MTTEELNSLLKNYKIPAITADFFHASFHTVQSKQLDNSRYIICTLTENGVPRAVKDDETARIRLEKPDKTYVYNECDIIEDGRILITLTEQMLAEKGKAHCDIQLTSKDGIIYSTKNFILNIDAVPYPADAIESSNEFDALNNMISREEERIEIVEKLEQTVTENENGRNENEKLRRSEETERQKNEMVRISSENQRQNAESGRIEAENLRKENETVRQANEADREAITSAAVLNAENAAKRAENAADDLQDKLDSHYFVLTEDKDAAGGVAGLDANAKIPIAGLYEATTSGKGITKLTDSVTSTSTASAATPNSVKTVYDKTISVKNSLDNEIQRAIAAENNLESKKLDKTTIADSSTPGLVKSGTDISVDSLGNVSVNDNSHNHIVSNLSDLTATADELNVLDGMTASTAELNYTKGLTGNIQTQLNAKAPLAGPVLTGTPKAPTASAGTNTTQIATTAFVQTAVSNHNTSTAAHSDIRELISGLTTRLNTLADSDDTTLDQLSEIVSYIKSNRTLIENVTTNKVNVSDITDNLTSTAANKPLSANQGKVLSDLVSTLTAAVDTKVDGVKGNAEGSYRTGNVNITPANIGLGNVPNVSTNNQTPTYTEASALAKLVSGEKLSSAFGKISKAVSDLISHIGDTIKHITSAERTNWTAAYTHSQSPHAPSNAEVNQNAFSNIIAGSTTISADSKTDTVTFAAGSNITLTPDAANDKITISSKDTNTHYTSKNVVGSSTATSNTTAALTNGNVYLNSIENGAVTSSHKISGSGATTVTTDASGNIIISSTDTNTTTDTKVTQTNTTASADCRVLLSGNANDTTETTDAKKSANFLANPNTGEFYAKGYRRINITNQTLDIDTLTLSSGSPAIMRYIEKTDAGAANITNIPVIGKPFLLDVELIRWASATDYITMQTFRNAANYTKEYVRICNKGTWTEWQIRVFTDTTYTAATTTANGLMSSADKTKLDAIYKNLNQNTEGQFVLSNGLKICWGRYTPPNANGYVRQGTVTFPITFSSVPYVFCSKVVANTAAECVATVGCQNQTATSVVIKAMSGNGSQALSNTEIPINWIAIGY